MPVTLNGTSGLTFPDGSVQNTAATGFGFKNRIINGDMRIDARNNGASVAITTSGNYTVDRWSGNGTQNSKYTVQQNAGSVAPPTGFVNYLGVTSSSAYSVGSGDVFWLAQAIEGLNVSDLGWGAAGAQPITLSFWVRSSLTGTFGGALRNSAGNRSYPFAYTIISANTWEQKTITITGDTSGTWLTTNGVGINLNFGLGAGSTYSGAAGSWATANYVTATGATSVVGTSGATFYITGVQLEKGSTATAFDFRDYGRELQMAQRYFQTSYSGSAVGSATTTNSLYIAAPATGTYQGFPISSRVSMRASPTVTAYSPSTGASGKLRAGTTDVAIFVNASADYWFIYAAGVSINQSTDMTVHYTASAEL